MQVFDQMIIATRMGIYPSTVMRVSVTRIVVALAIAVSAVSSAHAQVRFDDCQPVAGGGITCNTVPFGNARADMVDGEYGLMDQASPGSA